MSKGREVHNQVVPPLHKILYSLTKYSCLVRGGGTESYEPDLRRVREATSNDKKIPPQVTFTWQKHYYKRNNFTESFDVINKSKQTFLIWYWVRNIIIMKVSWVNSWCWSVRWESLKVERKKTRKRYSKTSVW